jgi:hypothetical protein
VPPGGRGGRSFRSSGERRVREPAVWTLCDRVPGGSETAIVEIE